MYPKKREKFYKAMRHYIRGLKYRRLEGWEDSSDTSKHFIRMINKYSAVLWPHAEGLNGRSAIKAGLIAQTMAQKKDSF